MKQLRVRPEAEIDAFEAALWYESERPGLGGKFLGAVREVLGRIGEMPLRFPIVFEGIRRAISPQLRLRGPSAAAWRSARALSARASLARASSSQ